MLSEEPFLPDEDPSSMLEALEPPEASEERERLAGWLGVGELQSEDFAFSSGDPLFVLRLPVELKLDASACCSAWRRLEAASFSSELILIRWEEVIAGDWLQKGDWLLQSLSLSRNQN